MHTQPWTWPGHSYRPISHNSEMRRNAMRMWHTHIAWHGMAWCGKIDHTKLPWPRADDHDHHQCGLVWLEDAKRKTVDVEVRTETSDKPNRKHDSLKMKWQFSFCFSFSSVFNCEQQPTTTTKIQVLLWIHNFFFHYFHFIWSLLSLWKFLIVRTPLCVAFVCVRERALCVYFCIGNVICKSINRLRLLLCKMQMKIASQTGPEWLYQVIISTKESKNDNVRAQLW